MRLSRDTRWILWQAKWHVPDGAIREQRRPQKAEEPKFFFFESEETMRYTGNLARNDVTMATCA